MKLLFDTMKRDWLTIIRGMPSPIGMSFAEFSQVPVIHIQNVANYFHNSGGITKDRATPQTYPNLAPPFSAFWMEFRTYAAYGDEQVDEEGRPIRTENDPRRVEDGDLRPTYTGILFRAEQADDVESAKWRIRASVFFGENQVFSQSTYVFLVAEDGSFVLPDKYFPDDLQITADHYREFFWESFLFSPLMERYIPFDPEFTEHPYLEMGVFVPFLAISFLHCKNVELLAEEDKSVNKPKRTRKRPTTKHYTLHIEPMKKILRAEGQSETLGLKHALHICRGHFKDYSKGSGLFGQHQGLYWWESHVRGKAEEGKIEKTYTVHPPKQDHKDE